VAEEIITLERVEEFECLTEDESRPRGSASSWASCEAVNEDKSAGTE